MEREVESILRLSGRTLEWRSWEEATRTTFEELTVVRFDGNCGVPPWPHSSAVEGPLGLTYISDGEFRWTRYSKNGAAPSGSRFWASHGPCSGPRIGPHDFAIDGAWPRRSRSACLLR